MTHNTFVDVRTLTNDELEELYSKLNAGLFSTNNLWLKYLKVKQPSPSDVDSLNQAAQMMNMLSEDIHTKTRISKKPLYTYHQFATVQNKKYPKLTTSRRLTIR